NVGLGRHRVGALAHVVARLRARLEQTVVLEQPIGFEDRGDADLPLLAQTAHRGHALAGAVNPLIDLLDEAPRHAPVQILGGRRGTLAPDGFRYLHSSALPKHHSCKLTTTVTLQLLIV